MPIENIAAYEITEEEVAELCDAWERRDETVGISITRLMDAIHRVKVAVRARRNAQEIDARMAVDRVRAAVEILQLGR